MSGEFTSSSRFGAFFFSFSFFLEKWLIDSELKPQTLQAYVAGAGASHLFQTEGVPFRAHRSPTTLTSPLLGGFSRGLSLQLLIWSFFSKTLRADDGLYPDGSVPSLHLKPLL